MKLGVLFSGGKDSTYALFKAMKKEEVVCLISIISKNEESYMFHTPNINMTKLQAQAINLPLIQETTDGRKEKELDDLKKAITKAKETFKIQGIVTGAIESVYQSSRIQKLCDELNLKCINPLWKKDQEELLNDLVKDKFKVIIIAIAAEGMTKDFLGKEIDKDMIKKLKEINKKYQSNLAGEGGEFETTVLDAPFFKKQIRIIDSEIKAEEHSGVFIIKKAELIKK